MATLLEIVRDAWARLGVSETLPTAVMLSADSNVAIMRALSVQEGRELAARATWQALTREAAFTAVAQEEQTGAIPADFERLVPDTVWNYTDQEPLIGPIDPQNWQALKASVVGPPDLMYRIRGSAFLIIPNPPPGDAIRFEYVSKWWVDTDGDGVGEADTWAADTNEPLLDAEALTLGIIWRWLKRNRLPYQDEFAEYKTRVDQLIARDGGAKTLNMGGRRMGDGPRMPGVPDGSWPL